MVTKQKVLHIFSHNIHNQFYKMVWLLYTLHFNFKVRVMTDMLKLLNQKVVVLLYICNIDEKYGSIFLAHLKLTSEPP